LSQSPEIETVYFIPGMPGIINLDKVECVDLSPHDFDSLGEFCKTNDVAYVVTGDSELLAAGVVDYLRENDILVFGPTKQAAALETSKTYAKEFMKKYYIPTVDYRSFTDLQTALEHIDKRDEGPVVVKADGLVHGRGVTVAQNKQEAKDALVAMMQENTFGQEGLQVVVEDYIEGPEVSVHIISDGDSYKVLPLAQDHKPLYDGNKGPNTGGMGTYAPVDWVPQNLLEEIETRIIVPTLNGLKQEGIEFTGLLFPGLMLTKSGPMVLEYNTRFGAPETQSFMMLLDSDLDRIFSSVVNKELSGQDIVWKTGYAATIELVSGNYPNSLESETKPISVADSDFNGQYFFSGAALVDGMLVSTGGKVVSVSSYSPNSLSGALEQAYLGVRCVIFDGRQYRTDIGLLPNIIPNRDQINTQGQQV
jgi:phosphoribosylamine--glycine ligase